MWLNVGRQLTGILLHVRPKSLIVELLGWLCVWGGWCLLSKGLGTRFAKGDDLFVEGVHLRTPVR